MLEDWVLRQLEDLADNAPYANGRVQIGLAFDGFFLPKETVIDLFERARKAGVKAITSHYVPGSLFGKYSVTEIVHDVLLTIIAGHYSVVDTLDSYGLLASDIVISHATNPKPSDIGKLAKAKAWISSTPDTELQMGHGYPICFDEGCSGISSLGVDCHSNNCGSLVSQMHLALQAERARRNQKLLAEKKSPRSLNLFVQDAFRLATIQGARAIRSEGQIGSIEVGKLADLVIFDASSPAMVCAAEQDPVAAIVLHSSVRDVEMVIVDGEIRKHNGKLLPVDISASLPGVTVKKQHVRWEDIAKQLQDSRARIERTIAEQKADDQAHQVEATIKLLHANADVVPVS